MPTYEYLCKKCGHRFDTFQKFSDEPLSECPVCKGTVQRLISGGTGLIFKGSGFYITDYKDNSGKKKAAGDEKSDKKSDAKSDTKTDGKSDNKSKSDANN